MQKPQSGKIQLNDQHTQTKYDRIIKLPHSTTNKQGSKYNYSPEIPLEMCQQWLWSISDNDPV